MADDSDLAYSLQLEEAIAASLGGGGGVVAVPPPNDALAWCDQEIVEDVLAAEEAERLRLDLLRQVHDRALACEIMSVPEEEWALTGANLHRPFGEGSSSSSSSSAAAAANGRSFEFKVHVKGLVEAAAGGIGAAICDGNDGLLFELSKGLSDEGGEEKSNELVEFKALIEGLDAAAMLDLKRVTIVTDNQLVYQHVSGKVKSAEAALSNQIDLLMRKFTQCQVSLVASDENKSVNLARSAFAFQVSRASGCSSRRKRTECCTICMEDTYVDQMFVITICGHSYCFSCMSKHVQFKLLQGMLPKCPREKCNTELKLQSCKEFLTPELIDIMSERVKETSIPAEDKIYCPYPRCSTLLSRTELRGSMLIGGSLDETFNRKTCPKCTGLFCMSCKVPWHKDIDCAECKRRNPGTSMEDDKLKSLAIRNLWRQCPKCNHMVSLASGCYHIYCRCGYEFCYTCGAEWKNKKATCKCPIWDERNIIYEQNRQHARR